jgi:hypothetical protein
MGVECNRHAGAGSIPARVAARNVRDWSMEDPVLLSRLKALSNNLPRVAANLESKLWQPTGSDGTRAELLEGALWDGIRATIKLEVQKKLVDLRAEIKKLDPAQQTSEADPNHQTSQADPNQQTNQAPSRSWERYNNILHDCQSLLRECLEIIGTLAIRNKDLDHEILHLADELVRQSFVVATGAAEHYYLTVPGLGDTLPAKRAHIIRMRFAEWTIWDLPLIAHEFGHVAITLKLGKEKAQAEEELRDLMPFLAKQQDLLLKQDPQLQELRDQSIAKDWAQGRVSNFVADAFAAFTMGPAYACSGINLRFNPCTEAYQNIPSDPQRAYLVMSMLEWMDEFHYSQMLTEKFKPYATVIAKLNAAWESAMAGSGSTCRLTPAEQNYLKAFARCFADKIWERIFLNTGMYPLEGWNLARKWCEAWLEQDRDGAANLATAHSDESASIRDVLNATWLCRLVTSDFARIENRLADAGKSLCKKIIGAASTGSGRVQSSTSTSR